MSYNSFLCVVFSLIMQNLAYYFIFTFSAQGLRTAENIVPRQGNLLHLNKRQLFAGFHGKTVGLELIYPGTHLGQDSQEKVEGRIEHAEKYQPGGNRGMFHVKSVKQALVGREKRK